VVKWSTLYVNSKCDVCIVELCRDRCLIFCKQKISKLLPSDPYVVSVIFMSIQLLQLWKENVPFVNYSSDLAITIMT